MTNSVYPSYLDQKSLADQYLELIEGKIKSISISSDLASSTYVPYFDVNKSFQRIVEEGFNSPVSASSEEEMNRSPHNFSDLHQEIVEINAEIIKSAQQQNVAEPEFVPTLSVESSILSRSMVCQISKYLPVILQMRNWELIYSPTTHGSSLAVFYRQCDAAGPSVLIIQDQNHHIFGGFVSDSWKFHHTYYGTGDCFLFTFKDTTEITCYFPTLFNDYYMQSDFDAITMGSG